MKPYISILAVLASLLISHQARALTFYPTPYLGASGEVPSLACDKSSNVIYFWVAECSKSAPKLADNQCGFDKISWGGEECALFAGNPLETELYALLQNASGDNIGFPNRIFLVEVTDYNAACESSLEECRIAQEYVDETTIDIKATADGPLLPGTFGEIKKSAEEKSKEGGVGGIVTIITISGVAVLVLVYFLAKKIVKKT